MKKNKFNKKGATGLSPWITGLIVTIFFTFCMVGFSINFLNYSNSSSEILSSKYGLNQTYNNMTSAFSDFNQISNETKNKMVSAEPDPTSFVFLIFQQAFYIPKAMITFIAGGIISMQQVLYNSLALNSGGQISAVGVILTTAITILISGLILTAVFLVLKNIRTGESER